MSNYFSAFRLLMQHEGLYSDNKNDPGGPTKYGISLRFLKNQHSLPPDINLDGDVNAQDIKNLNIQQASEIYDTEFWNKLKLKNINSQPLANMVMGMCVNAGIREGIKMLQEAINLAGDDKVVVDGYFGPKTLEECNSLDSRNLIMSYKITACNFYKKIIEYNSGLRVFYSGWLKRVNSY